MPHKPYPEGTLERLQAEMTEMLAVFDEVCQKLGLTYFIDGGTALGAARHGGFIPWDDDVDAAMPVADYRRFLAEGASALPEGYSLHTWENTERFPTLWAKIWKDGTRFADAPAVEAGMGQPIFMDVFPSVPLDADPGIADRQRRRMLFWQRLSYLKFIAHPKNVPSAAAQAACVAAHGVLSCVPQRFIAREFERSWRCETPGDLWIDPCYAQYDPMPVDCLLPCQRVSFDGIETWAPHDLDRYLTRMYGDWHKLPPEEERYTHAPEVLDFGDGVNVAKRR